MIFWCCTNALTPVYSLPLQVDELYDAYCIQRRLRDGASKMVAAFNSATAARRPERAWAKPTRATGSVQRQVTALRSTSLNFMCQQVQWLSVLFIFCYRILIKSQILSKITQSVTSEDFFPESKMMSLNCLFLFDQQILGWETLFVLSRAISIF